MLSACHSSGHANPAAYEYLRGEPGKYWGSITANARMAMLTLEGVFNMRIEARNITTKYIITASHKHINTF